MDFLKIAQNYVKLFAFNVLPLLNKAPVGDWIKWQQIKMNEEDLNSFKWQKVNGVGAMSGINELRCLDFDHVENFEIVKKFIRKLGLPAEYPWTVQSGSGKGYHIWFYCMDDSYLFKILGGEKSYFQIFPKEKGFCDHIELRWKKCQTVLPPSFHPSGSKYKFHFVKKITQSPAKVPVGKLIDTLEEWCITRKTVEKKSVTKTRLGDSPAPVDNDNDLAAIAEYLSGKVNNYMDWMRIGFALASCGEEGRKYFLTISKNNSAYDDTDEELNKKFDTFLKDYRGDITIRSFYKIGEDYGYKKPYEKFWRVIDDRAKISSNQIVEFLKREGYSKMLLGSEYTFIKENNNLISLASRISMKDRLVQYIYANATDREKDVILDRLIRSNNTFCSENTFEFLNTTAPTFITGGKEKEYFFFGNGFVEVTCNDITFNEYTEMHGKIWEQQKTNYDFKFSIEKSEFQVFIENICNKNEDRIKALRSAIGYLLVTYKDPSCAKAIIFTDEKLSENAYGRSGKGLVAKAIGYLKNILKIDGKNFSFDKQFMFQSVRPDTQLVFFDDVNKRFQFEKLFSVLTEGMTIERKNMNEYHLPFDKSPKILIATNHTVEGNDDSSLDRQFVVEFSDHYSAKYKPKDEFGHLFFVDWNNEQWYAFFNYMLECCRFFLRNGLRSYEFINLTRKKLIDSTALEFEEFIKSLPFDEEFNKRELCEQFKNEYPDFNLMRQNTFTNWIKLYVNLYNMEFKERKSGLDRFIKIIQP